MKALLEIINLDVEDIVTASGVSGGDIDNTEGTGTPCSGDDDC